MQIELDKADAILIETAERAMRAGIGRVFTAPRSGQRCRVSAIDEKWIVIKYGPMFEQEQRLPRKIREIARRAALLQGRIR